MGCDCVRSAPLRFLIQTLTKVLNTKLPELLQTIKTCLISDMTIACQSIFVTRKLRALCHYSFRNQWNIISDT